MKNYDIAVKEYDITDVDYNIDYDIIAHIKVNLVCDTIGSDILGMILTMIS